LTIDDPEERVSAILEIVKVIRGNAC